MVEIPEHLLKRSREAMARAKAAKGEAVEEPAPEAAEEAASEAEEQVSTPAGAPEPAAAGGEVEAEASAGEAASAAAPPVPEPGTRAVAAEPAVVQEAVSLATGAYPEEELVEAGAGIKEVAYSRAPGWLIAVFVVIPVIALLYMTQFSHGVQCGQAGTLAVESDGSLVTCDGKPLPSPGTGGTKKQCPDGAYSFSQKCAACHGPNGEGGVGLPLNKNNGTTLLEDFPDAASQIEFVTKGNQAFPQGWGAKARRPQGVMPGFGNSLSPEEIEAVVQHERSLAGEAAAGGSG